MPDQKNEGKHEQREGGFSRPPARSGKYSGAHSGASSSRGDKRGKAQGGFRGKNGGAGRGDHGDKRDYRDRKPYGDRDGRGEKGGYRSGKPYGDRGERAVKRDYRSGGGRDGRRDYRSGGERGDRNGRDGRRDYRGGKPYEDRDERSEKRDYRGGKRDYRGSGGHSEKRGYRSDDRARENGSQSGSWKPRGNGRSFPDRRSGDEGKPYESKKRYDERRSYDGGKPYDNEKPRQSGKPYERDRKPYERRDDDEFDERPRRYEGKPYGWRPRDENGNPLDEEPPANDAPHSLSRSFEKDSRFDAPRRSGGKDRRDSPRFSSGRDASSNRRFSNDGGSRGSRSRDGEGRGDRRLRDERARRDADTVREERKFDVSPARKAALEVGRMIRERDAFAQDLIASHIDSSRMSREDRAFAAKLVLGVVSAKGTLDEIINRCLSSPDDVQENVRDALRIGVYEIYFLDKSPHVAVDEGVELVRTFEPRACGVANFALRKAATLKGEFPFGNPKADLEAFARQYAFPVWLARRLVADLGLEAACDFMKASNEPAPLFAAVNAARALDDEVCAELAAAHGDPKPVAVAVARDGAQVEGDVSAEGGAAQAPDAAASAEGAQALEASCIPGCYRLSSGRVLQDGRIKRLINQGKLFVSDAASQEIACLVLPERKPASFLEVGAGRGTKTLLLQEHALRIYGGQIEDYVTLDSHAYKTELLAKRAETYGIDVAEPCTGNAEKLDEVFPNREFDVVFIDAPCSGLGTLRRHPEIRWRLTEKAISTMAGAGLAMLKAAASHVAVGGTLAYATCTVTHVENNGVVMSFLKSPEGSAFKLMPIAGKGCFATRLQPDGADAHFAVKMVRMA